MKISLADSRIDLAVRQTLRLHGARGLRVVCLCGELWLTQNHDRRDVILRPRQSFTLDRNGVALMSASQGGTVRLETPTAGRGHVANGLERPEWGIFMEPRLTIGCFRLLTLTALSRFLSRFAGPRTHSRGVK